jgi:simple sugar transport system ATP-binding protein
VNESSAPFAVVLEGIGKSFPGVRANYDIDLRVRAGTIHAIVGENGAGKSTLMKTLYGMHQPDEGTITVNGAEMHFKSPTDAIAAGIGMVHQHFMLADNLSVVENIILGAEPVGGRGVIKFGEAKRRISELMASLGVDFDLDAPVSALGIGQRQRVEILTSPPPCSCPRRSTNCSSPCAAWSTTAPRSSSSRTSSTKCWR